jgi:hypothetical protein
MSSSLTKEEIAIKSLKTRDAYCDGLCKGCKRLTEKETKRCFYCERNLCIFCREVSRVYINESRFNYHFVCIACNELCPHTKQEKSSLKNIPSFVVK